MSNSTPVAATSGGTQQPSSTIADISYRNYDGELRTRAVRWWIVAVATIRANVNRKRYGYWIPVGIVLIIYLFMGIGFYFTQGIRQQVESMGGFMNGPANPYALTLYQALSATNLLIFIATMTVGAASIAADNRANALLVYLSKPLTRLDYLLGKWMGIFILIAALTLIPSLLLFFFFAVAYNDQHFLKENPTLILRMIAAALVPAALHTSLIVGFSAWSKTPRLAGALYAAFYFVLAILAGVVGSILHERDKEAKTPQVTAVVANLSVDGVVNGLGMNLYDVTPQQVLDRFQGGGRRRNRRRARAGTPPPPPPASQVPERPQMPAMLLIGGLMIILPLAAAQVKIRAVEVIRG